MAVNFHKIFTALLTVAGLAFLSGSARLLAAEQQDESLEIKPVYIFQNKGNRDPFVPRFRQEALSSVAMVDITTFTLLGITTDSQGRRAALFRSKSGSTSGYVFLEGRLYGDNDEEVNYISGEWKGERDILLRQGDREVLFKMPQQADTQTNIYPDTTARPQEQGSNRTGNSQANP
ncbi:MAG: hypothetical protein LLG37_11405 [Spirochaetia bacterium]|nr:hypothetical protein [Spirochaetia bacterium]